MRHEFRSRRQSYQSRIRDVRNEEVRILIVCEGEKTEPNYFRAFRVHGDVIVEGAGDNTVNLVKKAEELRSQGNYDHVWCVFDRDSFPAQNFNAAISMAEARGIQVAYSNQAFELWYLLHYDFMQSGLHRDAYKGMLTSRLGREYKKNSHEMWEILSDRQEVAIRNSMRLLENYNPVRPAEDNPSTTVHLLVQQLRKHSRMFPRT